MNSLLLPASGRRRPGRRPRTIFQRLSTKFTIDDGCWLWEGSIDEDGYGRFIAKNSHGGMSVGAHRVMYELFVGPIPKSLQLNHLCHSQDKSCPGGKKCLHRKCVRPNHLEPVVVRENLHRSLNFSGNRTHCPKGHEYSQENTRYNVQWKKRKQYPHKICITCQRAACLASYYKKKAQL
jgi:hypothetical protein